MPTPRWATLIALSTLTLVFPAFTTSTVGPTYTTAQLLFAALVSLALWSAFVFVQTVRHRDYFLPVENASDEETHAPPPSNRRAWTSFGLLFVALLSVVGLAKVISHNIEDGLAAAGAPGTVLASSWRCWCCYRRPGQRRVRAHANRLQTSLNLVLGSALSSIGLTIPAVGADGHHCRPTARARTRPEGAGAVGADLPVTSITLVSGRTHVLLGAVHLVIFAAFLFLAFVP